MSESTSKTRTTNRKTVKPSERLFENAMSAIKDLRGLPMSQSETGWEVLTELTSALLLAAEEYSSLGDCNAWAGLEQPVYTMEHTLPFDRPSKLWASVAGLTMDEIRTKLEEVARRLQMLVDIHMPQDSESTQEANREGWDGLLSSIDFFRARQEASLLLRGLHKLRRGDESGAPSTSFGGGSIWRIPPRGVEAEEAEEAKRVRQGQTFSIHTSRANIFEL